MNIYIIYKHTSPSDKVYIGITKLNPSKRWAKGLGYKNNAYFYRAILKYGWENFKHEILLDSLTKEEAEAKEIELIAFYKSNDKQFGYNISSGGEAHEGCKHSELSILKMKKAQLENETRVKKVYQFLPNGTLFHDWKSTHEAARQLNINPSHIAACCRGERKTAGGFIWSYLNEQPAELKYKRNRLYYLEMKSCVQ